MDPLALDDAFRALDAIVWHHRMRAEAALLDMLPADHTDFDLARLAGVLGDFDRDLAALRRNLETRDQFTIVSTERRHKFRARLFRKAKPSRHCSARSLREKNRRQAGAETSSSGATLAAERGRAERQRRRIR